MEYDSRQLAMLISRAAHHLHAVVGNVATALIDTLGDGRMLFSNSALSEVSGVPLVELARNYAGQGCAEYPCLYTHPSQDMAIFFTVIDSRHVFAIIGKPQDELRVEEFTQRLRRTLKGSGPYTTPLGGSVQVVESSDESPGLVSKLLRSIGIVPKE